MKIKLLKRIRRIGASQITIVSVTTDSDGDTVGMCYAYSDKSYKRLFRLGDTEEDVERKAIKVYYKKHRDYYIKKYKKTKLKRN